MVATLRICIVKSLVLLGVGCWVYWFIWQTYFSIFRAQEPKAPVTYCDHVLSGVCCPSVRCPLDSLHFQLLLQNRLMDFDETGIDEVLMVPYKCCCFSARCIQGGGGSLLQRTSPSDLKATASNRMHSSDLESCGKKCCYFLFHSEVKFLTCFWTVILVYFNAISIDFYAQKSLICINFV